MLKIKDLHVSYGGIRALRGVDIEVPDGKIVTLIGANGAGKSTTLRTISGLVKADSGSITYNDTELLGMPINKILEQGIAQVPEGRRVFAELSVYENLKLDADTVHPVIDGLIGAIRAKNLEQIAGHMGNVLETVTIPNYPVIAEIKDHMMEHGAVHAMMSGSGPTVFGLFANGDTAVAAYEAMRESNLAKQVYLTSIYNNAR